MSIPIYFQGSFYVAHGPSVVEQVPSQRDISHWLRSCSDMDSKRWALINNIIDIIYAQPHGCIKYHIDWNTQIRLNSVQNGDQHSSQYDALTMWKQSVARNILCSKTLFTYVKHIYMYIYIYIYIDLNDFSETDLCLWEYRWNARECVTYCAIV